MTNGWRAARAFSTVVTLAAAGASAAVQVTQQDGSYHVHAPAYDATVEPDGFLTHLRAGGEELLDNTADLPRGGYCVQASHAALRFPVRSLTVPTLAAVKIPGRVSAAWRSNVRHSPWSVP